MVIVFTSKYRSCVCYKTVRRRTFCNKLVTSWFKTSQKYRNFTCKFRLQKQTTWWQWVVLHSFRYVVVTESSPPHCFVADATSILTSGLPIVTTNIPPGLPQFPPHQLQSSWIVSFIGSFCREPKIHHCCGWLCFSFSDSRALSMAWEPFLQNL